jgi:hypothetical protein
MCRNYDGGECIESDCFGRITCHDFNDKRCQAHSINGDFALPMYDEDDCPDIASATYASTEITDALGDAVTACNELHKIHIDYLDTLAREITDLYRWVIALMLLMGASTLGLILAVSR